MWSEKKKQLRTESWGMLAGNVWAEEMAECGIKPGRCLKDAKKERFRKVRMSSAAASRSLVG